MSLFTGGATTTPPGPLDMSAVVVVVVAVGVGVVVPKLEVERGVLVVRGGDVTSHVLTMALLSTRSANSKPKYLAPSTRASSSGLEADRITFFVVFFCCCVPCILFCNVSSVGLTLAVNCFVDVNLETSQKEHRQ